MWVHTCTYIYYSPLFLLFLKGTGEGVPDLYDIGLGLCEDAWLIIDENSGCYQLLILRS